MLQDKMKPDRSEAPAPAPSERPELFREHTRAPLEVPVRLKFDSFGQMRPGFGANVSRGGMFVSCAEPHPVGTLLRFELELSPSSAPVAGLGEVVWIRLKQRNLKHPPGMGIQFRHLDVESLSRLDAAVRRAVVELGVSEEPAASSVGVTQRADRLLHELEEALACCEDLGPTLDRAR